MKNRRLILICKYGISLLAFFCLCIASRKLATTAPLLVPTLTLGIANAGLIGMIVWMAMTGKVKAKGAKKRRRRVLPLVYRK